MRTIEITNRISLRRYFLDTIHTRSLILRLAVRDITVKYTNSLLGIMWALLEPVLTLLIFVAIFSVIIRFDPGSQQVPYAVLIISGIVCWQFFSLNISAVGDSLLKNESILTKVYFPHVILSISASVGVMIEFLIIIICFIGVLLAYKIELTWRALWSIPIILHIFIISLGPGLCIASLNIKYRDFVHLIPLILRVGFYASPVAYPVAYILQQERLGSWFTVLYGLNPMAGAIDAFRWSFFGGELHLPFLISSLLFSVLFLPLGITVFIKSETSLVDNL